jgi:hypothetical protein
MDLGNMLENIRIQTNRDNMARQEEANRNKAASLEAKLKVVVVRKTVTEGSHEVASMDKTEGSGVQMKNSKNDHWRLKEEDQRGREGEPPQEVHGSQNIELGQQIQDQKMEGQTQELEAGEKQKDEVNDDGEKMVESEEIKNGREEANGERERKSKQLNKKLRGQEMAEEKDRGLGNTHGQKFRGHDVSE